MSGTSPEVHDLWGAIVEWGLRQLLAQCIAVSRFHCHIVSKPFGIALVAIRFHVDSVGGECTPNAAGIWTRPCSEFDYRQISHAGALNQSSTPRDSCVLMQALVAHIFAEYSCLTYCTKDACRNQQALVTHVTQIVDLG